MDTFLTASTVWEKKWFETEFALSGALNDFVVTCKIKHFPEYHLWFFLCSLFFSPYFQVDLNTKRTAHSATVTNCYLTSTELADVWYNSGTVITV